MNKFFNKCTPTSGYEPGEHLSYQVHKQVDTTIEVHQAQLYGQQIDMEEPKSYSIEKLSESNYRSWSQVIESHLDDQDLWEVVQGKDKNPERPQAPTSTAQTSDQIAAAETATAAAMEAYEAELEAWTKKAKKARKMIISTISPSVMTYVEGTKDPAEMWAILEDRYKPKSSVTLRQLQRQFNTTKMLDDDGDMEKHLQRVERLKRQIEEQGETI